MGGDSLLIWSAAAHQQYSMICGSNSVSLAYSFVGITSSLRSLTEASCTRHGSGPETGLEEISSKPTSGRNNFRFARDPPRVSYSGTISQPPRRGRASVLQKGSVARLDDTL